jgi:hypothetical protein
MRLAIGLASDDQRALSGVRLRDDLWVCGIPNHNTMKLLAYFLSAEEEVEFG